MLEDESLRQNETKNTKQKKECTDNTREKKKLTREKYCSEFSYVDTNKPI